MGHWSGSSQNTRKGTTTTQGTYACIPSLSHYTRALDKKKYCVDSDVGTLVFVRESHLFLDISFTRVSIDEQESKVIEQCIKFMKMWSGCEAVIGTYIESTKRWNKFDVRFFTLMHWYIRTKHQSHYYSVQMRPTLSKPNLTFDIRFLTFEHIRRNWNIGL